ncbi:hypothetical protein GYA28_03115 [Candidatus Roizmanbacteria bacterium]|jgi:hypothetical protein|nr:hypothetical protein [Candidatus Roizmanbacteria bacterium]
MITKSQKSKLKSSNFAQRLRWARQKYVYVIVLIISVVLVGELFRELRSSFFFKSRDRINVFFYGQNTLFYSVSLKKDIDYVVSYPSDLKVLVPGGFGYYRLGGLGKLVDLEHKQSLYRRTFSVISSTTADFYFYPAKVEVYYDNAKDKRSFVPGLTRFFFNKSNANFLERAYLYYTFINKPVKQFRQLESLPVKQVDGDKALDEERFSQLSMGNFYEKRLRSEKANVQILYTKSEKNAYLISLPIEGQGIKVVDLSYTSSEGEKCQVIEAVGSNLKSAEFISEAFHCPIIRQPVEGYDIIFKLGSLEKDWSRE